MTLSYTVGEAAETMESAPNRVATTGGPLEQALRGAVDAGLLPPGASILLAVSGGADSLALLYAAAEMAPEERWSLSVGHIHHGWRGREADRDMAFVAGHAARLGLPFRARRRDARAEARRHRLSPEAGARRARYEALAGIALEAGAERIATAHQREDAVESYLLARERKAGVAGLGGPRPRREDGVVRPFLDVARAEILAFLAARALAFRRDRTNGDLSLARNRVRRSIAAAPEPLRRQWEREARRCAERRDALERDLAARRPSAIREGKECVLADAEAVRSWPVPLQRRAVEDAAATFARPGRPPMTGREREALLERIARGGDFRFEAGRRIAIERRGPVLSFRLRPGVPPGSPGVRF